MINLPANIGEARTLAQAIVNTIPEPFLVPDDGQWDIPALRLLLKTIIPEHTEMEGFEVEHDFIRPASRLQIAPDFRGFAPPRN